MAQGYTASYLVKSGNGKDRVYLAEDYIALMAMNAGLECRCSSLEAELKLQDQANDIMTHLLRKISRDYDRPGDWMPELQGALRSALETTGDAK